VLLRACAAAALAAGLSVIGIPSPAFAAPTISVTVTTPTLNLSPGGSATLSVNVSVQGADSGEAPAVELDVTTELGGDISCSPSCHLSFKGGGTKSIQLSANLAAGQSKPGIKGKVTVGFADFEGSDDATFTVNAKGPDKPASSAAPQSVPEISGTVKDSTTGDTVKNATVMVIDGARRTHTSGTDNNGRFSFRSQGNDVIAPGSLSIGATKEGFETINQPLEGRAGQALTGITVKMKPAEPSASASVPSDASSVAPSEPASGNTQADPERKSTDEGISFFSWALIIVGVLLVLFPVGVFFFLWRKREKDDPEDDENLDDPDGGPGPRTPGARGMFHGAGGGAGDDATMVAQGFGSDDTMVNMASAMSDETMIVNPPIGPDSYPSSGPGYGADPRGQETAFFGGSPNSQETAVYRGPDAAGYDDPRTSGYDTPRAGGYDPQPGYAPHPGYDDRTARYDDPRTTGYDTPRAGGYGTQPEPGYGTDPRNQDTRYAPPPTTAYDDPRTSAYPDPRTSAPTPGYDDPRATDRTTGYGQPPQTGRYDEGYPPASFQDGPGGGTRPPERGGRRSVEWLDD
jgi:hypothetical protein